MQATSVQWMNDIYAQEVRRPPRDMVHTTGIHPAEGTTQKPGDIVFTKADTNWVHHPHEDALVVMAKIANSIIHRMLVDNGSAANILFWGAYQKIRLTQANLSPMTALLYEFTRDHVISE